MENKQSKKKNFKEMFRKGVIFIFVWLVIISFVVALGFYNRGNTQDAKLIKVAEINKTIFNYNPTSEFYYFYAGLKQDKRVQYVLQANPKIVNRYALDNFVDFELIGNFAKMNKINASTEMIRALIENVRGRALTEAPDQGFLNYAYLQYANEAVRGNFGDLANGVPALSISGPSVTTAEMYTYADLINFNASAEFLYIDVTNYIESKISDKDLEPFYIENISNYASEATVDEVTFNTKAGAHEMAQSAVSNGWAKALADYKGKYTRLDNLVLKSGGIYAKRLALAQTLKPGAILSRPQFENGEYHVFIVKSFPSIKQLTQTQLASMAQDYSLKNFSDLRKRYDDNIKNAVAKAEEIIKAKGDLKAASASGMTYIKSGKVSPVSSKVADEKGNAVNIPLFQNSEWTAFLFTSPKNAISKTYYTDSFIVIMKVLDKAVAVPVLADKIDEQMAYAYAQIKSTAVVQDWMGNLRSKNHTKTYQEELDKATIIQ